MCVSERLQILHRKPAISRVDDGAGGDVVFPSRCPGAHPLRYGFILQGGAAGDVAPGGVRLWEELADPEPQQPGGVHTVTRFASSATTLHTQ